MCPNRSGACLLCRNSAGEAEGVGRAKVAVDDALDNPLLESAAIAEARGCLVNVTGGADLTLFEVRTPPGQGRRIGAASSRH